MVPPDNAAARSRSRILRLDNIQRGRRYRRPNDPRLYDRDQSSLNDGAAGKPGLNHSLTRQPEQFCGKRQPELYSLPRNHKRHHRPQPRLRLSTNRIRNINAHSIRASISPTEHVHNFYRWGKASGKLSHNVTSILRVVLPPSPDFSITSSPFSINVTRGSATSATVTLTSIGGFAGQVNLTTSISPSNGSSPTLTLNPNRITLLSGGTGNAVLTVNTTGATSLGSYTIVVLGISGTLANTVSITLTVQ